jgi:chromosome partitioning protein
MQTITCTSLSGGQGKTTTSIFLGRALIETGHRVLMIDADPQSSLTFYLGHEVQPNQPTLLEVLKKLVPVEDGVYEVQENLWLIPSDDALDNAQDYLSGSGMGAIVLGKRLKEVSDLFQFCIIDAPPQRSQICLTTVGAADYVLIPAEASSKGVNSLIRTLDLIQELKDMEAFEGSILGILPFRDRWTGRTQANQSKKSIETMRELAGKMTILPSILESEQFKKAIDQGKLLKDLGYPNLEHPFQQIVQLLVGKE